MFHTVHFFRLCAFPIEIEGLSKALQEKLVISAVEPREDHIAHLMYVRFP